MNVNAINNLIEEYYFFDEYNYLQIFYIILEFLYEFLFVKQHDNTYYYSSNNKRSNSPINYTEYSFVKPVEKFNVKPVQFNSQYSFNSGEKYNLNRPKPKKHHSSTYKFQNTYPKKSYYRTRPRYYDYKPSPPKYDYYDYKPSPPKYDYYDYKPPPPKYDYKPPPPKYDYKPPPSTYNKVNTDRQKAFQLFGLSENCDKNLIKKRYHKLALKWHPDKNNSHDAESMFKKINKAYHQLIKS